MVFETSKPDLARVRKATEVSIQAGADYVKTSIGFNDAGATVEAVQSMLETAKGRIKVKASGEIRTCETAKLYVDKNAVRLGVGYAVCNAICKGETAAGSVVDR